MFGMSDYINPDAITWREDSERLHRAGEPHQWRLFGMVACRLCQADRDAASESGESEGAVDGQ